MYPKLKKTIGKTFAISLLALLCGSSTAEPRLNSKTLASISKYLETVEAEYRIVGQSVAILKNGDLAYSSARGFANLELNVKATNETVYQVFSVAKLFVHVTIMELAETGKIELDAPISGYLTDLPMSWSEITIREALSHTSGLPEFYRWPDPTPKSAVEALNSVADMDLEFPRGSTTRYNQTNYLLLKMVIEVATGKDFLSIVTSRMIDAPILKNTRYGGEFAVVPGRATTYRSTHDGVMRNVFIDQPDYMIASSNLNSSAIDLARWFTALLDHQFISQKAMNSMWTPLRLNDGTVAKFANGWEYSEHNGITVVGHGGGNRADVRHYVRDGDGESVTIVYLTNGSQKDFWPGDVSRGLARIIMAATSSPE